MKKSEYERQVAEECDGFTRSSLAAVASKKAEAAGVVWDPEEPELTRRIAACGSPAKLVADEGAGQPFVRDLNFRELHEVVRRYNAWEEIRMCLNGDIYVMRERIYKLMKGETNG